LVGVFAVVMAWAADRLRRIFVSEAEILVCARTHCARLRRASEFRNTAMERLKSCQNVTELFKKLRSIESCCTAAGIRGSLSMMDEFAQPTPSNENGAKEISDLTRVPRRKPYRIGAYACTEPRLSSH
jgi:hypothetical protein